MALLVQKFGGTSVSDAERIRQVAEQVKLRRRQGDDIVLVVSAMGKETDELLRLAKAVSKTHPGREMDMLITAGERKSIALMCMALHDIGIPADSYTGSQAGFLTDTNHRNAKILEVRPYRIRETIEAGRVAVVAGAQGVSTDKNVTFLGMGGSDTTAVALANALDADSCELFTDVSGVFTTDPRICSTSRKMHKISFDEMLEMAAVGCPKPAMRSVEVAQRFGVPLHVRSAFTWETGTLVTREEDIMEQAIVSAITPDTSEAKVKISGVSDKPGVAAAIFKALADEEVNVDMIVQNTSADGVTDISFTVPCEDLDRAMEVCDRIGSEVGAASVEADKAVARISVIGAGMKSNPGVAALMFETLADANINIQMISTSPIRVSCVIAEAETERAVELLHDAYELANSTH